MPRPVRAAIHGIGALHGGGHPRPPRTESARENTAAAAATVAAPKLPPCGAAPAGRPGVRCELFIGSPAPWKLGGRSGGKRGPAGPILFRGSRRNHPGPQGRPNGVPSFSRGAAGAAKLGAVTWGRRSEGGPPRALCWPRNRKCPNWAACARGPAKANAHAFRAFAGSAATPLVCMRCS